MPNVDSCRHRFLSTNWPLVVLSQPLGRAALRFDGGVPHFRAARGAVTYRAGPGINTGHGQVRCQGFPQEVGGRRRGVSTII